MNTTKNLGMLLLSIYLIAIGLMAFIPGLASLSMLTSLLAIAAGVCILTGK